MFYDEIYFNTASVLPRPLLHYDICSTTSFVPPRHLFNHALCFITTSALSHHMLPTENSSFQCPHLRGGAHSEIDSSCICNTARDRHMLPTEIPSLRRSYRRGSARGQIDSSCVHNTAQPPHCAAFMISDFLGLLDVAFRHWPPTSSPMRQRTRRNRFFLRS